MKVVRSLLGADPDHQQTSRVIGLIRRAIMQMLLSQAGAMAHTYPHRAREVRVGQRYTSPTCARRLFVPLLATRMGEWRMRTETR
jgi:hypothetical protein